MSARLPTFRPARSQEETVRSDKPVYQKQSLNFIVDLLRKKMVHDKPMLRGKKQIGVAWS